MCSLTCTVNNCGAAFCEYWYTLSKNLKNRIKTGDIKFIDYIFIIKFYITRLIVNLYSLMYEHAVNWCSLLHVTCAGRAA